MSFILFSSAMEKKYCGHIKELYELENDPAKTVPGMHIVPKLKYEHIHLIPFSKMRVDLAAQVS